MGKNRWSPAPEMPTIEEAGVPGLTLSFWQAFWVPKGTPRTWSPGSMPPWSPRSPMPAVRQRLHDLGQESAPREQQTPEALGAYHKAEIEKWWPIIKAAGLKAE